MHAPTRVPAARSKISIAFPVPLTLALAVAVKVAFCPGCAVGESAVSSIRIDGPATSREEMGTLGVTMGPPAGGAGAGVDRIVSVQAAGLDRAGMSGVIGHAERPSGIDATPGVGWAQVEPAQAVAGPEAGH
jgi:hypothetical protein